MTLVGIGLEEGEGESHWKESHRQEWAGFDWKTVVGPFLADKPSYSYYKDYKRLESAMTLAAGTFDS